MSQVALEKRRHPDGFLLWDVFLGGVRIGLVRQHAVAAPSWFVYEGFSGEDDGHRYAYRRDAVAALVERPLAGEDG